MLAMFLRFIVVAILVVTGILVGSSAPKVAAATCVSSVGPGIPAPANPAGGIPGFHASWYGQSGYPTLCPGERATSVVAYYNSGSRGWVLGRMGEVAYLGTWSPSPGQDQPTPLGGDGTNGSPNTGWPRYNRIAVQPAPYVGPGQVAWFQFTIQAPQTPGYYKLYLRPLIEGATWMEDYGVFWQVTVLNPDGTYPPPPTPPAANGCREWPSELGWMLARLSVQSNLCLLPYEPVPYDCRFLGGCYTDPDSRSPIPRVWVRSLSSRVEEVHNTAHETCHAHISQVWSNSAGYPWSDPMSTSEGLEFKQAYEADKAQLTASGYTPRDQLNENFAELCAEWYVPLHLSTFPEPLMTFARNRWAK